MKIVIAGDFSPKARGVELIKNNDFEGRFEDIRMLTSESDYSIVNFETNVSTPISMPIEKHGPNLTTIPQAVDFIKYLGFNVVTLANNHFYDYGDNAVDNTLRILDDRGIKHVGGGRNIQEAKQILYLKKDSVTLALINVCEHEFSIAAENHGGANPIDPVAMFYAIQEAKKNADYVLCIIHGGHEHFQLPSLRMQDWYRFFVDAGADVVVNHHQHCYSGMEVYKGKPIYYGLGNFFFDSPNQKTLTSWNEGIMVELKFSNESLLHKPIPYIQCVEESSIILKDDLKFRRSFEELNRIISERGVLVKKCEEFYLQSKQYVLGLFEPYVGRILKSAYSRKLLPSLLSKAKMRTLLNMTECEAHIDRLRFLLKEQVK